MKVTNTLLYVAILGMLLLATRAPAQPPPVRFITAPAYPAGAEPRSVAAADFNRDGIPDLAGDGKLDLAFATLGDGSLTVLLGNGDGTFGPPQCYGTGSRGGYRQSLTVGDFNGDGIPDLVAVDPEIHPNEGIGSVLLGNGDGSFQPALTFSAGFGPGSVAVGDFNGDGRQDLVTCNLSYVVDVRHNTGSVWENDVRVFFGNGDGTFQAGQAIMEGGDPVAVAVGDFNGDGIPDIALVDAVRILFTGNTVTILLGTGDGSFENPQHFVVGGSPVSLVVGDFNSDGRPDLAVADLVNPGAVTILLNAGAGGGGGPSPPP